MVYSLLVVKADQIQSRTAAMMIRACKYIVFRVCHLNSYEFSKKNCPQGIFNSSQSHPWEFVVILHFCLSFLFERAFFPPTFYLLFGHIRRIASAASLDSLKRKFELLDHTHFYEMILLVLDHSKALRWSCSRALHSLLVCLKLHIAVPTLANGEKTKRATMR